jgi:hypothetical protein
MISNIIKKPEFEDVEEYVPKANVHKPSFIINKKGIRNYENRQIS